MVVVVAGCRSLLNAKATQRTARRLKDAAIESSMAVPLLLLIGQNTSASVFNREFRQLKLIGEVYDKCHEYATPRHDTTTTPLLC
eukprot:COSAG05_NODE_177_length_14916_cov_8.104002_9_plen_85_part_00